jgi:23S rRNA (pseudouridine1915-N3)-methyltransferase
MKVAFWCIGKTDDPHIAEGFGIYQKRLSNYLNFEYREINPPKSKKPATALEHKETERDEILKILKQNDTLVLLDEAGKEFDSVGFSTFLQKSFHETSGSIVFLAGGPYGFHQDIYSRAKHKLSLSQMTFTHQMVRLIFIEQLYRAMTIIKGEKYHH